MEKKNFTGIKSHLLISHGENRMKICAMKSYGSLDKMKHSYGMSKTAIVSGVHIIVLELTTTNC